MATDVKTKLLTAEEFMAADLGDGTFELVRGEVIQVPPTMPEHGVVCANVVIALGNYGRQTGYGYPLANDSAGVTERGPDTVPRGGRLFLQPGAMAKISGGIDASSGLSRSRCRGLFPGQSAWKNAGKGG